MRMHPLLPTADIGIVERCMLHCPEGGCYVRQLPNFGELFGSTDGPSYITERGTEVWMYRRGHKVRFYDRAANQIGPEHSNVYPATVWVFQQGWYSPTAPQWLNDGYSDASGDRKAHI
jgi:hypothetical protein